MKISTAKHFFIDSLKSLNRNRTISTASIATVATTLFVLGVFLMTILNVNRGVLELQSKVELEIFLQDDITINQQRDLENKLKASEGVVDVSFVSKAEAFKKARELFSNNEGLMEGLEEEYTFPSSFIVKVDKPDKIVVISDNVKDMQGIKEIRDASKIVSKIMAISKTIKIIGGGLLVLLIGVSLFLIGNTIKITVYTRRREIGIMKFIGATDWFIRWPFIFEGLIIGFLGAFVAIVILYYGYRLAYANIPTDFIMMKLVEPAYIITNTSWQFAIIGILIGSVGSILAIRKFLSV